LAISSPGAQVANWRRPLKVPYRKVRLVAICVARLGPTSAVPATPAWPGKRSSATKPSAVSALRAPKATLAPSSTVCTSQASSAAAKSVDQVGTAPSTVGARPTTASWDAQPGAAAPTRHARSSPRAPTPRRRGAAGSALACETPDVCRMGAGRVGAQERVGAGAGRLSLARAVQRLDRERLALLPERTVREGAARRFEQAQRGSRVSGAQSTLRFDDGAA